MYTYNELIEILNINSANLNRFHLKSIIHALVDNEEAYIDKQKIFVDIEKVKYLWYIYINLSNYFDYKYNSKSDLKKFFSYLLNENGITLNAIFCPGYTKIGYKNYIGNNNTERILVLNSLKKFLESEKINAKFRISLADIFLENTNKNINPALEKELFQHIQLFINKTGEYFENNEIIILSEIFTDEKYIKGFVSNDITYGKNYLNFYKNNHEFYQKMNWSLEEIKERNDKLYTIYTIISEYILAQNNGIYLPMETMYSRSKVMTHNNVCTMYLNK